MVSQCVRQAVENAIDPREHMDHINWSVWAPDVLTGDTLNKLWIYISREVRGKEEEEEEGPRKRRKRRKGVVPSLSLS